MDVYSATMGNGGRGNSTGMCVSCLCMCCLCVCILSGGVGFWKRCEWFDWCGNDSDDSGAMEESGIPTAATNSKEKPPKPEKSKKKPKETREQKEARRKAEKAERAAKRSSSSSSSSG